MVQPSLHQTYNQLHDWAQAYAVIGMHVFPLRPQGKEPLPGSRGLLEASNDPDQISAWWTAVPDANIGISCGPSNLVVVDIDPSHGGWDSVNQVTLPETGTVYTGSGGAHLYYEGTARTRTGIRPGIDIRATGGYVVAPPSIHPNGQPYQWLDMRLAWDWPQVPDWVVEVVQPVVAEPVVLSGDPSNYVKAAIRGELDRIIQSANGTRNDTLNRASFSLGQLVGAGLLNYQEAINMLEQAGLVAGLSHPEVIKTVRSGVRSGMTQPRQVNK